MDLYNSIIEKYSNSKSIKIDHKNKNDLILRSFILYKFFNGDDFYLDEIENSMIKDNLISSVIENEITGEMLNLIAVNFSIPRDIDDFINILQNIDLHIAEILSGVKKTTNENLRRYFVENKINEEKEIKVTLLISESLDFDLKSKFRILVNEFDSKVDNLNFELLFEDDIIEIVKDYENPTPYVLNGNLLLTEKDEYLVHGTERSIITSISAKSLKELYIQFSTKGLFASNLRYYVKSSKIDSSIRKTIINEPKNFWYFNNGIIITCSDYVIKGKKIELFNFSIVNGGQTTSLIGNTHFDQDFSVMCKVIKNKFQSNDKSLEFLSKVAEASNTQKPIKVKDLIANRIEQRKLKIQYDELGVFLQLKRGESINRSIYKEKWQFATNEEVGQLLFSIVYQRPGNAKNAKSAMLQNEMNYRQIFQNKYDNSFLLELQYLKSAFLDWKNLQKKDEDIKRAVSINAYYMMMAVIGFLCKVYINDELRKYLNSMSDNNDLINNEVFKNKININDIGQNGMFQEKDFLLNKIYTNHLFDFIYQYIIKPTFIKYKNENPNFGLGHYSKSDANYYNNVLKFIINLIKTDWESNIKLRDFLSKYFRNDIKNIVNLDTTYNVKLGLKEELDIYRKKIASFSKDNLTITQVISNIQMSNIIFKKPRTIDDLKKDIRLTENQIENYGEEILRIVERYLII